MNALSFSAVIPHFSNGKIVLYIGLSVLYFLLSLVVSVIPMA